MATKGLSGDSQPPQRPALPEPEEERLQAWELVERGRYRPLRIRGSFPGRELG
jgi:hypothetical protein